MNGVDLNAGQVMTRPTWEHPRIHSEGRPMPGWDEVFTVLDQIEQGRGRGPAHQVGGNPSPVQGPVELEVAYGLVSKGSQDKVGWSDPAVREASDDWILPRSVLLRRQSRISVGRPRKAVLPHPTSRSGSGAIRPCSLHLAVQLKPRRQTLSVISRGYRQHV